MRRGEAYNARHNPVEGSEQAGEARAISKHRLGRLRGTLTPQIMTRLERALRIALDLL